MKLLIFILLYIKWIHYLIIYITILKKVLALFEKGEPRYSVAHYVVKDISDFGNAVQVVGKNESYKYEELQLVKSSINPPLNIPGRANINVVAKEYKVARQLRDLNIDQGNVRQGKRNKKRVVQRLDL